jgi:hypothetical protein
MTEGQSKTQEVIRHKDGTETSTIGTGADRFTVTRTPADIRDREKGDQHPYGSRPTADELPKQQ